ncbi:MAG: thiamine phosphate synthase [Marinobacter sp.]|nr:thiamine phosphate synthase [Marinobacter sp.]
MNNSKGILPGLYVITDPDLLPGSKLLTGVEAALAGGAVLVQYRDKKSSEVERLKHAQDLVSLCMHYQVPLLINDDPALAKRVRAQGAHLGQQDGSLAAARQLLGPDAIIGATCHGQLALAERAQQQGADYLAFGRFFTSGTKPGAPSAELSVLTAAKVLARPLTAIGGVTLANGADLIRAGADLLAVIGDVFSQPDICSRAKAYQSLFQQHHAFFQSGAHHDAI